MLLEEKQQEVKVKEDATAWGGEGTLPKDGTTNARMNDGESTVDEMAEDATRHEWKQDEVRAYQGESGNDDSPFFGRTQTLNDAT